VGGGTRRAVAAALKQAVVAIAIGGLRRGASAPDGVTHPTAGDLGFLQKFFAELFFKKATAFL